MHFVFEITSGHYQGRKVSVREGQSLSFGRTWSADVSLPTDATLSSCHFVIENQTSECRIRDSNSTNGTFVNGVRVAESLLRAGDTITAGTTQFRVSIPAEGATHPATDSDPSLEHRSRTASQPLPPIERPSQPIGSVASSTDDFLSEYTHTNVIERESLSAKHSVSQIKATAKIPPATSVDHAKDAAAPMLAIDNRTSFSVGTLLWENQRKEGRLTIIIKATFTISEEPTIAGTQLPLFDSDLPFPRGAPGEVRLETDRVPFKPRTDIVVAGRVHAPGGRPVTQLDARISVGAISKTLRVFGDRSWSFPTRAQLVPRMSSPEPFTSIELTYRRSFGGIDESAAAYCPENLVGVGMIGKMSPQSIHGKALPNFEDPTELIQSWETHPRPAGFGFYGRGWMPRLKFAGTYDEKHRESRSTIPPADASHQIFNGAHPDLQVNGYLRGDETVELVNLSPQGTLRFCLPQVTPHIRLLRVPVTASSQSSIGDPTRSPDESSWRGPVRPHLDTLVFLPEQGIGYEVFRSVFAMPSIEHLDVSRILITHS